MSSPDEIQRHARSFGRVADAYDRGRPGYPAEAVAWLTSALPLTILELGAGTGKLTRSLVEGGHQVHATDPDEAMLRRLQEHLPEIGTSIGSAEEIPAEDNTYDVVVAAQSFRWFDLDRAMDEIVRVLKPGGRLALVDNHRDERIPWVRKLGAVIGEPPSRVDATDILDESMQFVAVERETFEHWQTVDRRSIVDLVLSRSNIAVLDDEARAAKAAEVLDFYDGYGRGMDGMQLPYRAVCIRARVVKRATPRPAPAPETAPETSETTPEQAPDGDGSATGTSETGADATAQTPGQNDGSEQSPGEAGTEPSKESEGPDDDDGVLLIDFR